MTLQQIAKDTCIVRNTAGKKGRTVSIVPGSAASRYLHHGRIILDEGDPAVRFDNESRHGTLHDLYATCLQSTSLIWTEVHRVHEEDHVVGPLANQKGMLHGIRSCTEDPDGLVADLPSVAIGTVQKVAAPSLASARDVWQLVADPRRDQQAARFQRLAAR